ncbi:MAG: hypothetical protein Q2306_01285 [Phytoplasma sp.]|uniref:hypothetical protein n=1 Tax=Phytoplasma sp. TaxID=2155 RepID=UPI002B411F6C|nr:hypothetical protein [Phytoplasma sp.]WRH06954.1 MAG: hypothetical protein Q2306_01285 [Phytoplasma sp.]
MLNWNKDGKYKDILSLSDSVYVFGTPMIDRTYTFFGFNGLNKCQYPEKVPSELGAFVKNKPFSEWWARNDSSMRDRYNVFQQVSVKYDNVKDNSLFTLNNINRSGVWINHNIDNKETDHIKITYDGPKYILDTDQDWYLCKIDMPREDFLGRSIWPTTDKERTKTYFLHFNPVKQYITLYTEPMNTQQDK